MVSYAGAERSYSRMTKLESTAISSPYQSSPRSWLRRWLRVAWRTSLFCTALAGLLMLVVTFSPLDKWWVTKLAGPWNDPNGDVLIVLGASEAEDGIIGYSTYLRCQYAIEAWRHGGFRTLVVSGGGSGIPVALGMRDFLVTQGIPADDIVVETASRSTRENALYTAKLLGQVSGTKVLLTSDFHMYRAHRAFIKAGLDVLPRPFPDAGKRGTGLRGRWPVFLDLVTEVVKIGYYRTRGWI